MTQDEELHAELMRAFQVYFKANQTWLNKGTKRSAIRLRQALSEIRRICSERRVVVREWAIEKEAELDARAERRAQKQGTLRSNDDN